MRRLQNKGIYLFLDGKERLFKYNFKEMKELILKYKGRSTVIAMMKLDGNEKLIEEIRAYFPGFIPKQIFEGKTVYETFLGNRRYSAVKYEVYQKVEQKAKTDESAAGFLNGLNRTLLELSKLRSKLANQKITVSPLELSNEIEEFERLKKESEKVK